MSIVKILPISLQTFVYDYVHVHCVMLFHKYQLIVPDRGVVARGCGRTMVVPHLGTQVYIS